MSKIYDRFERVVGGLKFAVIIILVFSLMMTIGTFLESYYGTEFANRTLYKKFPFMLVQFLMFLSICLAAFIRLPPKKRLYGFYTIHSGLVLLGCGSFITWYAGVDGHVMMHPNEPARHVYLDQDIISIVFPNEGRVVEKRLPYTAFTKNLNKTYDEIQLGRYYPYSESVLKWREPRTRHPVKDREKDLHSGQYFLFNNIVQQELVMSLHPEASQFDSTLKLGPLNIHYLPSALASCFDLENPSRLIVWDARDHQCYTPEAKQIEIKETGTGNRFLVIQDQDRAYSFFPDFSPYPLTPDFSSVLKESHLRLFNRKLFEDEPHLFLFGPAYAVYLQDQDRWLVESLQESSTATLPWMDFQLRLLRHEDQLVPAREPEYTFPIQKNNELIRGRERALEVIVRDQSFWVTNIQPISLMIDSRKVELALTKETILLPFEFVLTEFKMDTDPGTNNPASFESFVKLFTSDGPEDHHIFMNNPLKYQGFTFYQASYSQNPETGVYSSTLAANVDQGRFLKYLGSLFLVFGTAWHYQITRRKKQLKPENPIIATIDA